MDDTRLKGMTALISGASSGIGAATALALGKLGAYILLHCHNNTQGALEILDQIRTCGGDGAVLQSDLSTAEGIRCLIGLVRETGWPVDILVNNAGSLLQRTRFLDFSDTLWDQVMTLNLTSAVMITRAVLAGMVERRRGFIVNISSVAARNGGGIGAIAYATAKGALSTLTKGLAKEFAPQGIRVNAVSPGTVDTNYHRNFSTPESLQAVAAATPLQRIGTPEEVADVVVFLCSEQARFIQGQVIEVNGGFLMV
jgi:NAD(P)-dependent dehydrogenase (short-subunit alcohol dehydrogenase family)